MAMRVDADSDARIVGDEARLMARRTCCPLVVDSDRVRAVGMLIEDGVDVVIADDGLQHYRLWRDYEICVVDGTRGHGNRRLLPAGPLREPLARLQSVDTVLTNGEDFALRAASAVQLNSAVERPLKSFSGTTVHAIAGIGNPQRFFDMLRLQGMQVIEHPLADHAKLSETAFRFGDDFSILMTEKDAVKLSADCSDKLWYVPVNLEMNAGVADALLAALEERLRGASR